MNNILLSLHFEDLCLVLLKVQSGLDQFKNFGLNQNFLDWTKHDISLYNFDCPKSFVQSRKNETSHFGPTVRSKTNIMKTLIELDSIILK